MYIELHTCHCEIATAGIVSSVRQSDEETAAKEDEVEDSVLREFKKQIQQQNGCIQMFVQWTFHSLGLICFLFTRFLREYHRLNNLRKNVIVSTENHRGDSLEMWAAFVSSFYSEELQELDHNLNWEGANETMKHLDDTTVISLCGSSSEETVHWNFIKCPNTVSICCAKSSVDVDILDFKAPAIMQIDHEKDGRSPVVSYFPYQQSITHCQLSVDGTEMFS
ncbi:hypothetical protein ABZP36_011246 [Zizania latifolia]